MDFALTMPSNSICFTALSKVFCCCFASVQSGAAKINKVCATIPRAVT